MKADFEKTREELLFENQQLRQELKRLSSNSQQRILLSAIQNSPTTVVITDKDGNIEYANPAFSSITGYSLEEVKGNNPRVLKSGMHSAEYYTDFWNTIKNGNTWQGEFYNKKKDGSFYWEKAVISPVFDENKETTHFVAIKIDITEQRQTEIRLRENEKNFRNLFELTAFPIILVNLEGKILHYNKAAIEFIEYDNTVLLENLNTFDFYWKTEDRNFILKQLNEKGEVLNLALELRTMKGKKKWAIINARIISFSNDNVYMVGIADITHIKETEQKLRHSQAQIQTIFNTVNAGIALFSPSGSILLSNNYFSKLFNCEPFEINSSIPNLEEEIQNTISIYKSNNDNDLKNSVYHVEKEFRKKNWEIFWGDLSIGAYISGENEIEFLVATIFDISKRKTIEKQLEFAIKEVEEKNTDLKNTINVLEQAKKEAIKANNTKSEFLANMSHEIRTPMNAILGFAELLKKSNIPEESKEFVNGIEISGKNLMAIINDLLDLSKIEAGFMTINFQPISLRQIVQEIQQIFQFKANEKNIDFQIIVSDEIPNKIKLDEVRFRQIMINLVGNALKFTQKGFVKIDIDCNILRETNKCQLFINVIDTGIGIPQSQQKLIFDAFRQVESQRNRKYEGTGLGLTISKKLAEMMNGTITLISEPEKGSTFSLILSDLEIIDYKESIETKTIQQNTLFECSETLPNAQNYLKIENSNELFEEWEKIEQLMSISDVQTFAQKLIKISELQSCFLLEKYAKDLHYSAAHFDYSKMYNLFSKFPQLIGK